MVKDTKTQIVETSIKLFAEKGFNGTSVKDICDMAGVNISSVNYHFNSKVALFEYIMENVVSKKLSQSVNILDNEAETLEEFKVRLGLLYENFFRVAENDWESLIIMFSNLTYIKDFSGDKIFEVFNKSLDRVSSFINAGVQKGYLKKGIDTRTIAKFIFYVITGELKDSYMMDNKEVFDKAYQRKYIKSIVDTIVSGISC